MKRITKIFLALCIVGLGTADASFPVTKEKKSETVSEAPTGSEQTSEQLEALANSAQAQMDEAVDGIENAEETGKFKEEDWILLALWFFLGGLAAHRWYAKKPVGWNILFILTLGGCGVWAIVDLVKILTQDFM